MKATLGDWLFGFFLVAVGLFAIVGIYHAFGETRATTDTASTPIKLDVYQEICLMVTYSANGVEITPCEE